MNKDEENREHKI